MGTTCRLLGLSIVAALVTIARPTAQTAAPTYAVSDLGDLGGASAVAYDINAAGQVVGQSATDIPGELIAFLWLPSPAYGLPAGMHSLGTLDGTQSEALGINASGQVVGRAFLAGNTAYHAVLWPAEGGIIDLGTLGGRNSQAFDINDAGEVVGWSDTAANRRHAFSWRDVNANGAADEGEMVDLGDLGGDQSIAYGINASGQIVGTSSTATFASHAFRTTADGAIDPDSDLGTLGGFSSTAYRINAAGQVVGHSLTPGNQTNHAFRTAANRPIDPNTDGLGSLGGSRSEAWGINARGQAVGWSYPSGSTTFRAFFSSGNGMVDLNTLIDPAPGWTLTAAYAITDAGEIVATGSRPGSGSRALLLRPGVWTGDLTVVGTNQTHITLSGTTLVTGSITISNNPNAEEVNLATVTAVGGDVTIAGNTAARTIDLGALVSSHGDVNVANNGAATQVIGGSLAFVNGSLAIESVGEGTFSMGRPDVAGDTTFTTAGYATVSATTARGTTNVSSATREAIMNLRVEVGGFAAPVDFDLTHLDPASLLPEAGLAPGGVAATIDPVVAYQLTFAVPTLNRTASLAFEVVVSELDMVTRGAFLQALVDGTATLATRSDLPGAAYQAFPLCVSGEEPTADGCVRLETFDAAGRPTTGVPALVRFSAVVGHFSTWAVVMSTGSDATPPVVTPIVSGMPGANGWYVGDVSLHWEVRDDESAVTTTGCEDVAVTSDVAGAVFTCTATSAGGTASGSVTLNRDATPPRLILPVDVTVEATGPGGAVVHYAGSAVDNLDPSPRFGCEPASGSTFPIGTTAVTCTATDDAGNAVSATFTVRVRGAVEQILSLWDKTRRYLDLRVLEAGLRAWLEAATAALLQKSTVAACRAVNLYVAAVTRTPSSRLSTAEKGELIADAQRIQAVIGCR